RLHATLERKGRALHPHPPRRMGIRPDLAELHRTSPRPAILRPLLQPTQTTRLTRRASPDQPRSQRLWGLHLDHLASTLRLGPLVHDPGHGLSAGLVASGHVRVDHPGDRAAERWGEQVDPDPIPLVAD